MVSILNLLTHFFKAQGNHRRYVLAFSGGLDSQVLLHASAQLRHIFQFELFAVHIHHGLSAYADIWQTQCENVCALYDVPFHSEKILAPTHNIEAASRTLRYAIFAKLLRENDILLTAHHANDQAETLLLQLCRGAGTKGLASMQRYKSFAKGYHARPFLAVSRAQLQAYATTHAIHWIEDESNQNTRFARNFIRHEVLPLLQSRWPSIIKTLARSAEHCAETSDYLHAFIQPELTRVRGDIPETLSAKKLSTLSESDQRLVIRAWLHECNIPSPNTKKLQTMLQSLLTSRWDKQPRVHWQAYEMRRHRDEIYVCKLTKQPVFTPKHWNFCEPFLLDNVGQLHVTKERGRGLSADLSTVKVKFREGGEKIFLGKRGNKTLKNLFQEWGVVPWKRDKIPLLYAGDRLVQVVGYCVDPDYAAREEGIGYVVRLIS